MSNPQDERAERRPQIAERGRTLGMPYNDWPAWCGSFQERLAYQCGVADGAALATQQAGQVEPVASLERLTHWTYGPNVFKDWCAQWFGPDSDDEYLGRAARALLATATPPATGQVERDREDGFETVLVKNFGPLIVALDRAERKGYLPDALADEWAAFELRAARSSEGGDHA